MPIYLNQKNYADIVAHAEETFPGECCGFVVRRDTRQEVARISNIQDEKHAEDPERYPRTAATAYTMGPEAAVVMIDHEHGRLRIECIYHSHPQHDAYFSAEDRRQAMVWDEPSYPDAAQIVLSVRDGVVRAVSAFAWHPEQRDFLEVGLRVEED